MNPRTPVLVLSLLLAAPAFGASGDADVGRKKSEPCKACHGEAGISVSPDFPNLAGQHADYLRTALSHYKNGKRKNPIMVGMAANLTQKDILDLAAHFSHLEGLQVKH